MLKKPSELVLQHRRHYVVRFVAKRTLYHNLVSIRLDLKPIFIVMLVKNNTRRVDIIYSTCSCLILGQGRRQEFFQGRALGGSGGGLPSHFSISRGRGAQPRFLAASMVKMKEFLGQGGHDLLAYACLRPWCSKS